MMSVSKPYAMRSTTQAIEKIAAAPHSTHVASVNWSIGVKKKSSLFTLLPLGLALANVALTKAARNANVGDIIARNFDIDLVYLMQIMTHKYIKREKKIQKMFFAALLSVLLSNDSYYGMGIGRL